MDFPWAEYEENSINEGGMSPSKGWRQKWGGYYKAIRTAATFISHIDMCQDVNITDKLKAQYKAEAVSCVLTITFAFSVGMARL